MTKIPEIYGQCIKISSKKKNQKTKTPFCPKTTYNQPRRLFCHLTSDGKKNLQISEKVQR